LTRVLRGRRILAAKNLCCGMVFFRWTQKQLQCCYMDGQVPVARKTSINESARKKPSTSYICINTPKLDKKNENKCIFLFFLLTVVSASLIDPVSSINISIK
jgi:hypothetical protein